MKFTWFNLMPWPYLPDDFREKNRSVWVDMPSRCSIRNGPRGLQHLPRPARIRRAGRLRRHRRQRAPSKRLRHDAVAQHHGRGARAAHAKAALVVLGNSIALYNPPIRVAEEFAMLDVHLGRAAGRRLPGRHLDGHQLLLRPDPGADAREIRRSARPDHQGLDEPRAVRLQRPLQQAALRQLLAASRSRSRIRRSSFPAAARSRPTTSASTTPTRIPTSASPATCAPSR